MERKPIGEVVNDIETSVEQPLEEREVPIRFEQVISTGSTLLDLAISGSKVRGGGLPGGILVEVYGPSGAGKSSVLAEVCGCIQRRGGEIKFKDPEGRLDQEYAEVYGVHISEEEGYSMPDTIIEAFADFYKWNPKNSEVINGMGIDSLAALSTEMELSEGDAYGMRRAKEFSQELRKTCRIIARNNWLIVCSNQIRDGGEGKSVTPGGKGIPFYASLRIEIKPCFVGGSKIEEKVKLKFGEEENKEEQEETEAPVTKRGRGKAKKEKKEKEKEKEITKIVGVRSKCTVTKSTVDDPFRECNISIIFGLGIDDLRDNLIYVKEMTNGTKYSVDGNTKEDSQYKSYVSLKDMITYVTENSLESILREKVIDIWEEIEAKFKAGKRTKVRF
jgi:RecA/RadA recombinase